MTEFALRGCTPEPLMNYLKALGILRLVTEDREDGDPNARGWWRNDVFVLRSRFDGAGLEDLFLNHYRPTPLLAPWNGGSGFYLKWDEKKSEFKEREAETMLRAIERSTAPRLSSYRVQIADVRQALRGHASAFDPDEQLRDLRERSSRERWGEARLKKEVKALFDSQLLFRDGSDVLALQKNDKDVLIAHARSSLLSDEALLWLDSAFVIRTGHRKHRVEAPLLGSGGNIGNSEFSVRFMQMLSRVLPLDAKAGVPRRSSTLLRSALFDVGTPELEQAAVDQFHPGRAGGANMGQGMGAGFRLNPWDYILMLEGALMIQGAASRRLGSSDSSSAFPFAVDSTPAGFASAGLDASRGEQWFPLWQRPCTSSEIGLLLAEGRAEFRGKSARTAVELARAAATLGVDRGIPEFVRVQYQARLGDNYLANALGRIHVVERNEAYLLREIDSWLDRFRAACSLKNVPTRFAAALRAIDTAVFDFCQYGGALHFADVLTAVGAAERELALTGGKVGEPTINPLTGLSPAWIEAARGPYQAEFEVALALAQMRHAADKVGPLRSNLEPVRFWRDGKGARSAGWAVEGRAVVWSAADLATNLTAVLARRLMDAARTGCEDLPLESPSAAPPTAIAAFLRGELDDRRIEDLLWGLMLVDPESDSQAGVHPQVLSSSKQTDSAVVLPPVYALLKLLFLPRPLVPERRSLDGSERVRWRLAHWQNGRLEDGIRIRPEPAILALLRAGRVGDAAAIAMRRLRTSRLVPLPHRRSGGPARDSTWKEVCFTPREGQRLAAALLIPLRAGAVDRLVRSVTRTDDLSDLSDDMRTPAEQES